MKSSPLSARRWFRALFQSNRRKNKNQSTRRYRPVLETLERRELLSAGIQEFSLNEPGAYPLDITLAPNGQLWFVNYHANQVNSITTSGTLGTPVSTSAGPDDIAVDQFGKVWYTAFNGNMVGQLVPGGTANESPTGSYPDGILIDPAGDAWFAEDGAMPLWK
jgi:streptogramin lyase